MSGTAAREKVGYKRPPKHSQFKKGQSGNPGGRRRLKSGTIRDALEQILQMTWDADTGTTYRDKVAAELVSKALIGRASCLALLLREFE